MPSTLREIADDVCDELVLARPAELFPDGGGDETAQRVLRAITWTCRYLARDWDWPGIERGLLGAAADSEPIYTAFTSEDDQPWPDAELLVAGAVWRVRQLDGMTDGSDYELFRRILSDVIWNLTPEEPYATTDSGMPGWRPRVSEETE